MIFSIAYTVVCVPNYSVPPYSLISTFLERTGPIPKPKMILMYTDKCQRRYEYWFIFLFLASYLDSGKNSWQVHE